MKPVAGWSNGPVTVVLTQGDLVTLNNALNETLNSLDDPNEFATRVGVTRDEAEALRRSVAELIAKTD